MTRAIVCNENGGIRKFIKYANDFQKKEVEWNNLPFLKPYKQVFKDKQRLKSVSTKPD